MVVLRAMRAPPPTAPGVGWPGRGGGHYVGWVERIAVVGSGGAGKTTFSLGLGRHLGLPVVHLDEAYWRPGWQEPSRAEWLEIQHDLLTDSRFPDGYVVDGNYRGTLDARLAVVDTVIVLDLPTWVTLPRALKRTITNHGISVQAAGCPERFDLAFYWYIARFRRRSRPRLFETLRDFEGTIHVLTSRRGMKRYLDKISNGTVSDSRR